MSKTLPAPVLPTDEYESFRRESAAMLRSVERFGRRWGVERVCAMHDAFGRAYPDGIFTDNYIGEVFDASQLGQAMDLLADARNLLEAIESGAVER